MTLPLPGRRSELAKSSNLFGLLVGPPSQPVPLTDQAFVTHVDKFVRSVRQRTAIKEANARIGKYRNDSLQLCCPAIGKRCKRRGGRWRSAVSVLVSFREAGKHHLGDALFSFAQSRQQLVGMLVENALRTAVRHVVVMGKHDGL